MKHLVRDVSRVLTLFLASRQAWPKILGGEVSMFGGKLHPQRCLDKTLCRGQTINGRWCLLSASCVGIYRL